MSPPEKKDGDPGKVATDKRSIGQEPIQWINTAVAGAVQECSLDIASPREVAT
jgi:hypothetical protein